MNTERSEALVARLRGRPRPAARRVVEFGGTHPAPADEVFPLLCPAREADWIPGWSSELIFTESGYAETDCVFRTGDDNVTGPGVWVIHTHEAPRRLELTRFMPHLVLQLRIVLTDNGDGTTDSRWRIVTTALDADGDALVADLPADDDRGDIVGLLNHYLEHGRPPAGGHGHAGRGMLGRMRKLFAR